MSSKVRKIGRVQIIDKNGRRYSFEVSVCGGKTSIANQRRDSEGIERRSAKTKNSQFQDRPPVEEPPNEPRKPPVEEPGEPPEPPPPPSQPPVEEPPNEPDEPPVKEPPPKEPDREPPRQPPVKIK